MNPSGKQSKPQDQTDENSPQQKSQQSKQAKSVNLAALFDPANVQNAQQRLTASANKTKTDFLTFFNNADSQIASFFNDVKSGLSKNTQNSSGKKSTQSSQYERKKQAKLMADQSPVLANPYQQKQSSLQSLKGIHIEENPSEREVFLTCPSCSLDVFDTGLSNMVSQVVHNIFYRCSNCKLEFDSEKRKVSVSEFSITPQSDPQETPSYKVEEETKVTKQPDQDASSNQYLASEENKVQQFSQKFLKDCQRLIDPMVNLMEQKSEMFLSPTKLKRKPSLEEDDNLNTYMLKKQQTTETSSKYVNELDSVLLFVVRETVLEDFQGDEGVKLKMLLEKILMPFFQLRTRILEKNSYFKIGEVMFYIPATAPYDFGKVTAHTTVRLTQDVSTQQPLERLILAPMKRYSIQKQELLKNVLQPFFQKNLEKCLFKNQVVEIDDEHEFFVRYCRPSFGKIQLDTNVQLDTSVPKSIVSLRVAPIWATQAEYDHACQKRQLVQNYLLTDVLTPFLKNGLLQHYIEKGETLDIFSNQFFINDCQPRQGIINSQTVIELEVGFTQATFYKKQVIADQRMAERMMQQETADNAREIFNRMRNQQIEQNRQRRRHIMVMQAIMNNQTDEESKLDPSLFVEFQEIFASGISRATTPGSIVQSLPLRRMTSAEIEKLKANGEDGEELKCLVCITEYEHDDQVRTMPCLHYFHKDCIDKWLLERGSTCPVCKFNIKKDYNITSLEQVSQREDF